MVLLASCIVARGGYWLGMNEWARACSSLHHLSRFDFEVLVDDVGRQVFGQCLQDQHATLAEFGNLTRVRGKHLSGTGNLKGFKVSGWNPICQATHRGVT